MKEKRWKELFPRPVVPKQKRGRTVGTGRKFKITGDDGREFWVTYHSMDSKLSNTFVFAEEHIGIIDAVADQPERWPSIGAFVRQAIREKLEDEGYEVPDQDFFIESVEEIKAG